MDALGTDLPLAPESMIGALAAVELPADMRLIPSGDGYIFVERTSGDCQLLNLIQRTFSIALRAPIDPANVEIVHE